MRLDKIGRGEENVYMRSNRKQYEVKTWFAFYDEMTEHPKHFIYYFVQPQNKLTNYWTPETTRLQNSSVKNIILLVQSKKRKLFALLCVNLSLNSLYCSNITKPMMEKAVLAAPTLQSWQWCVFLTSVRTVQRTKAREALDRDFERKEVRATSLCSAKEQ